MTLIEAKRQLNIGYIFAFVGFLIGVFASEDLDGNIIFSGLIIAYALWGTYWGFVAFPINRTV